jgi:phosphocarrier protein HPr
MRAKRPKAKSLHRVVTITNKKGLHARAAAKFVSCVERFEADVTVIKQDLAVSGRSIMGLMLLAAAAGSEIELRIEGPEARAALKAITELIAAKFGEE